MNDKFDKAKMTVDGIRVVLNSLSNMTEDDTERLSGHLKGMDATVGQKGAAKTLQILLNSVHTESMNVALENRPIGFLATINSIPSN